MTVPSIRLYSKHTSLLDHLKKLISMFLFSIFRFFVVVVIATTLIVVVVKVTIDM